MSNAKATVALVFRGTREMRAQMGTQAGRLGPIFDAMAAAGLSAEPCVYLDEAVDEVREQLLRVDGALVWVDPVTEAGDRSKLDPLLREVSSRGVFVSSHPDVILKMGTKEVLVQTKSMGWGSDCYVYRTPAQMQQELPLRLAGGATRVLKQYRGNGGIGVYRVALTGAAPGTPGPDARVLTQHARFGSAPKEMTLQDFMSRMEKHFAGDGRLIDQPFQQRAAEGMTRCYMVQDKVAGFGVQRVKALLPPPPEGPESEQARPGPRIYHGVDLPEGQALRDKLEREWIPELQRLLDIPAERLPMIWDADFLYGPKTPNGEDTYVLCEINISAVFPFPDQALPTLAEATARAIESAKRNRVAAAKS